ncbi:MAG: hypothetical protein AAF509_03255 [Pseudomonadota bacterium]
MRNWERIKTDKWAISGGAGLELGAILSGSAKLFTFQHIPLKKTKRFVLVSAGVGAKLEASFEAGSIAKGAMDSGGNLKRFFGVTGNPFTVSEANILNVHKPFCIQDLYMATAFGISTGVDAALMTTTTQGINFRARNMTSLFTLSGVQIEAIIGIGINIYTLQGGVLFGDAPGDVKLNARERQDLRDMRRFGMRAHAGKI